MVIRQLTEQSNSSNLKRNLIQTKRWISRRIYAKKNINRKLSEIRFSSVKYERGLVPRPCIVDLENDFELDFEVGPYPVVVRIRFKLSSIALLIL